MKIERISENQIRCTLTGGDLSVRNLNLGELAYGSEKARNLFREMIQKASNEVGFEAEDIPLMVEAIPLGDDSVILVITKIEDPDELDTRFSKFAPPSEEDLAQLFGGIPSEVLEGADNLLELLKKEITSKLASADTDDETTLSEPENTATETPPAVPPMMTRIYRFQSLDEIIIAARATVHVIEHYNALYKSPSGNYYLVLTNVATDKLHFSRLCNILAEYGEKIKAETASEAYYKEHYDVIIKNYALQKLAPL